MPVLARRIAAAAAVAVAATAAVVLPGTAAAAPATAHTFSIVGDEGDYLTGGRSYDYSADLGDQVYPSLVEPDLIRIRVNGANGDFWRLEVAAPVGEQLAPGAYPGAARFAWAGVPGLDLVGEGRGCNEVAGAFTIDELVVQDGRLVEFEADFEVRCEGREPAARGHVQISGAP